MTDLNEILSLWQQLRSAGEDYVLATVVEVEGSGYRKPGARMIIAPDGRRRGTISGGCLEGEVARKAFWHTENGPVVRRYSTAADDGDVPYGMGCGGVVYLLLERSATASPLLDRLSQHFHLRQPLSVATMLEGESIGYRSYHPPSNPENKADTLDNALASAATEAYRRQRSFTHHISAADGLIAEVRAEWISARPGLFIFGAGDDAMPVVKLAHQLGWYVAVADGRSNLATTARFPEADEVNVLGCPANFTDGIMSTDAALVMAHSLEQDTRALEQILQLNLSYIGVLGPRRRTADIVGAIAKEIASTTHEQNDLAHRWMSRLHAPMGLDLGGQTPADIALAIIAEIQQTRHHGSGQPLREMRRREAIPQFQESSILQD